MRYPLLTLLPLALLAACTSTTIQSAAPTALDGGDGGAPPGENLLPADQLGGTCALIGSPGHISVKDNSDCPLGKCIYDGVHPLEQEGTKQTIYETYCSADCSTATCPTGWDCTADEQGGKVCLKQPAVCGDASKQVAESCDDGNVVGRDGCSADCRQLLPSSLDILSLKFNAGETAEWIPKLPVNSGGTRASIDEVTTKSFRLQFAVLLDERSRGLWELRIPRTVGVVPEDPTLGFLSVTNEAAGFKIPPEERFMEVLSAGADGRSFRVSVRGNMAGSKLAAELVVTLP
jgi:cysteine-rich repeat protein